MRALDKVFSWLGYERPRRRAFQAASVNRLTGDWSVLNTSADTSLVRGLSNLRARSRDLLENNDYFQRYLSLLKTNIAGPDGICLKNKAIERTTVDQKTGKILTSLDVLANRQIEDAWGEWGKKENCTVSKDQSWKDLQAMAVESIGTDGEFLARKLYGKNARNKFGFALQLLPADVIDIDHNVELKGGSRIRMGVEKDAMGMVVAYHIRTQNPAELSFPSVSYNMERERVLAKDIIHPFLMRRIGQTRGFPWAAAVMERQKMLHGYDEAELVAARTGASKHGFFKRTTPNASYKGETDGEGNRMMDAEPGTWEELPPGLEPVTIDWQHPSGNYDPYVKACLRAIAAGLLVSYPTFANDYAGINFSSGRLSRLEEIELWKYLQRWLTEHFHDDIFSDWLESAMDFGSVNLPMEKFEKFNAATWRGRRWSWFDPGKEVKARISELNSGLTSLTRVLAEIGVDRDELLDEIQDDQAALEARGITLPELYQAIQQKVEAEPAAEED